MAIHDTDGDYCNSVFLKICDHYGVDIPTKEMTESAQTVLLVWQVASRVDNGGFELLVMSYFDGDPTFELTLQAFENLGSEAATSAVRDVIALFPDGKIQDDPDQRMEYYWSIPDDVREKLNERFWSETSDENKESIAIRLAKFIRTHYSELGFSGS